MLWRMGRRPAIRSEVLLKLSIISRYLVREIGLAWVGVTLVLVVVLFANRLIRYLGAAASGTLPGDAILTLMGYKALSYTAFVLPGSFYLAVILAMGRLYRDSEMSAMGACGIGPGHLYRALTLLMIPLVLLVAWLSFEIQPWAAREGREAEQVAQQAMEVRAIRPGRFLESSRGGGVFYIEGLTGDGERMRDVFLQVLQEGERVVARASEGYLEMDPDTGDQYLVLEDGYRYDAVANDKGWRLIQFQRHGVRITEGETPRVDVRRDGMPTRDLIGSPDPRERAELHWRIAMPVMVVTLGLLAIPLSRSSPRDGRYGRLLLAVLLFVVYFNLLTVAQGWLEAGRTPDRLGLWPVHLSMVLVAVVWMLRVYRIGLRRRRP